MRILYITMLLLFCTQVVLAQDTLKFKDGRLVTLPSDELFGNANKITSSPSEYFTQADIDSLHKLIAVNINRTYLNIKSDSLKLTEFYRKLYGPRFLTDYLKELEDAYNVYKGAKYNDTFKYLPNIFKLDSARWAAKYTKYTYEVTGAEGPDTKVSVKRTDLTRKWLLDLFNNSSSNLNKYRTPKERADYINGWRELEKLKKDFEGIVKDVSDNTSSPAEQENVMKLAKEMLEKWERKQKSNAVVKLLKEDYYKSMLWYTQGIPVTNPFFITDDENAYPDIERYPAKDSKANELIARNKAMTIDIQHPTILYNTVELKDRVIKNKNMYYWMFLADKKFADNGIRKKLKYKTNDDKFAVYVFNLPDSLNVEVDITKDTISGNPEVLDQLSAAANVFSAARTTIGGLSTTIATVLSRLNSLDGIGRPEVTGFQKGKNDAGNPQGFSEGADNTNGIMKNMVTEAEASFDIRDNVSAYDKWVMLKEEEVPVYIYVDSIRYLLSKDPDLDCKLLLGIALKKYNTTISSVQEEYLVKKITQRLNFLNYKDSIETVSKVDEIFILIDDYLKQLDALSKKKREIIKSIRIEQTYLAIFTSLLDRSLPILKLEELPAGDKPLLSTKIKFIQPNVNKKVTAAVSIQNASKSVNKPVGTYQYKTGGRYLFMGSAGIVYSTGYTNNVANVENGIVKSVENKNKQLMATVGLHIYPGKLYTQDDRFVLGHGTDGFRRLSIYLGVGIADGNALEHFYHGLSVDLIPGVKLITGPHFYLNYRYEIYNTQLISRHTGLGTSWFTSLNLDPVVFTNIFKIFQ